MWAISWTPWRSCPTQSMAAAVISFVGQNMGAGREDRARQGVRISVSLAIGWTLFSSALVVWQSNALSRIFSPDPAVIAASARYLQCVMPPYALFSTLFVLNSAMRGAGDSLYPMFNVVASVILLPGALPVSAGRTGSARTICTGATASAGQWPASCRSITTSPANGGANTGKPDPGGGNLRFSLTGFCTCCIIFAVFDRK